MGGIDRPGTWCVTDLTALALAASVGLTAAELHGAVCGVLAADPMGFELETLLALVGDDALSDQAAVRRFVDATAPELFAPDLSFTPLLPEDGAPLPVRTAGLAQWCGSFASGFAAAAGDLSSPPEEVEEILHDFIAISEIETDPPEGEAGERDLFELVEFARVGALLLVGALARDAEDPGP